MFLGGRIKGIKSVKNCALNLETKLSSWNLNSWKTLIFIQILKFRSYNGCFQVEIFLSKLNFVAKIIFLP